MQCEPPHRRYRKVERHMPQQYRAVSRSWPRGVHATQDMSVPFHEANYVQSFVNRTSNCLRAPASRPEGKIQPGHTHTWRASLHSVWIEKI